MRYFAWNFKGYLWNSTQNISPIPLHWKLWFLYNIECPRFKSSFVFFNVSDPPPRTQPRHFGDYQSSDRCSLHFIISYPWFNKYSGSFGYIGNGNIAVLCWALCTIGRHGPVLRDQVSIQIFEEFKCVTGIWLEDALWCELACNEKMATYHHSFSIPQDFEIYCDGCEQGTPVS